MHITRRMLVAAGLVGFFLLPPPARAAHVPIVLTDVAGGEAEGKGRLVQDWLTLKITGLPPETEILVEVVESPRDAPRRLGQVVTRDNGQARLRIDLNATPLASGATIQVRPVTEGSVRDVVLRGKIP